MRQVGSVTHAAPVVEVLAAGMNGSELYVDGERLFRNASIDLVSRRVGELSAATLAERLQRAAQ